MTMKTRQPKTYGMQQKQLKKEVYSNKIVPQETRKTSNKQPKLTPKAIRERRTKKPQGQKKERNHKVRSEINEKEMKETIAKINKTKSWFFEKMNKMINHQPDSSRKKGEDSN